MSAERRCYATLTLPADSCRVVDPPLDGVVDCTAAVAVAVAVESEKVAVVRRMWSGMQRLRRWRIDESRIEDVNLVAEEQYAGMMETAVGDGD